ncbi:nicotinate-nucleotide adenylyltransferase [Shimia abyssi]|uniref:Probable nicotinate-nucleotide adenylyltransferase n=1 Tax=Shimia abyssi TaxID=1662395 RepID=A0A2P8F8S2_9RHOB|nr:nicotinate-nucleotide adenylyltransferase [Shimia abyssi]PSL18126.1 nicotinate-nucleotide adenylyltransferase [Shimia abyssi]
MTFGLPYVPAGQVVGLLGGSFDPPHTGHVQITKEALKRFGLDRVWWLVSPGNPLKNNGPAPLGLRMDAARALMTHPKVTVSDFEVQAGTKYTAETIRLLQSRYPKVRFVWLMGADNLAQFHQWKDWQEIMERVPVGVLARPGDRLGARQAKAARMYASDRIRSEASRGLALCDAPAWCFLNIPMTAESSSRIRESGHWTV